MDDFGTSRTVRAVRWAAVKHLLGSFDTSAFYKAHDDRAQIKSASIQVSAKLRQWLSPIIDLSDFPHAYSISGIHAGIDHWLAGESRPIYCIAGEYPYVRHANPHVQVVNEIAEIPSQAVVYLSMPWSANGRFTDMYDQIENPIVLDLAYVGTTLIRPIATRSNVELIFWSPSKTFGTGNFRMGYVFMRQPNLVYENLRDAGYLNYQGIDILSGLLDLWGVDWAFTSLQDAYLEICRRNQLIPGDSYLVAESINGEYPHLMRENGSVRIPTGYLLDKLYYKE